MAKKRKKKTAKAGIKKTKKKLTKSKTKKKAAARKTVRTKPAAQKLSPKNAMLERELEEGLMETFPASDPVALTDPTTSIKD